MESYNDHINSVSKQGINRCCVSNRTTGPTQSIHTSSSPSSYIKEVVMEVIIMSTSKTSISSATGRHRSVFCFFIAVSVYGMILTSPIQKWQVFLFFVFFSGGRGKSEGENPETRGQSWWKKEREWKFCWHRGSPLCSHWCSGSGMPLHYKSLQLVDVLNIINTWNYEHILCFERQDNCNYYFLHFAGIKFIRWFFTF